MPAILGMAILLAAPDPTFQQATVCGYVAAAVMETVKKSAEAPTATDEDRYNQRIVMTILAKASERYAASAQPVA